jgi:hypothetical protein
MTSAFAFKGTSKIKMPNVKVFNISIL